MIPELGNFALILALCLAIVQFIIPLIGTYNHRSSWMRVALPATRWQFGCLALAFACLTYAYVVKDFSVLNVVNNNNSALPLHYRISAVWGNHEGSLLLWVLLLSGWAFAVSHFSTGLPLAFRARVLSVLGFISIGFLLFVIFTSNPFERVIPAALDGRDLNPLLQDIGLIIHPPMLYMGYVGLAVPFAFAIAALLEGRIDSAWTRWTRPWTTVAWVFLTIGIALGSWWAYYELGWGGWWFWDPVENASFMPWLLATALLHCLAVTEQRSAFKAWTILLSIFGFSLSLLGTFLVRSGVLVSVHAFASDPERGVFVLAFLCIVVGSSLVLYAWRAVDIQTTGRFSPLSRESLLLMNNVLLVCACAMILLGTLYPIIHAAMGGGSLSVGKPYFDLWFSLFMLPLALVLGIGPIARWKKDDGKSLSKRLYKTVILALLLALVFILLTFGPGSIMVTLSIILACWVIVSSLHTLKARVSSRDLVGSLRRLPRGYIGMLLAHLGFGVVIIGVTFASAYTVEKDVSFSPGDEQTLSGYTYRFSKLADVPGPNYRATRATIDILKNDKQVATLHPEKRYYFTQEKPMTEAGINAGFFRDIYVSLGEPLEDGAWAVRLHYKPYVRWLWLGPLLMALGGFLSASDKRYRLERKQARAAAASTTAVGNA